MVIVIFAVEAHGLSISAFVLFPQDQKHSGLPVPDTSSFIHASTWAAWSRVEL